ncbi:MAG: ornithine carbamoyltransferase [Anaerolineales bacterium]|nr:ornithine carbamoyltransferase [Anaerolineales bacterium]MCX7608149.1 ornithine carbamoyltransferase [Anaerolineales bacterium]MDW8227188.1 ornithine carbamoyltransferase [Anaerolineales bacterium]
MRHFLDISDHSSEELQDLLDLAVRLKQEYFAGGNPPLFKGKVLAMIFQKPSLRTRVSFDMAMRHMGGDALYLSPNEIGLGKREAISDVARVLSGYVQAIMARVFAHEHVLELARWSSVPVINGLSDYSHPCQAMADALTIQERFGKTKGLNVVFVGDGNNVAVSLMQISVKLGWNFTIANPEGYDMPAAAIEQARQVAAQTGSKLAFLRDPHEAVRGAHVIYTDTWVSMGQEDETAKREAVFPPYQVNAQLVSEADKDVIVMHCLPAHRNQELTDEVADGPHSVIFQQAHNRLHAQKAILARLFGVA